jgi:hypothetical protein
VVALVSAALTGLPSATTLRGKIPAQVCGDRDCRVALLS